MALNGFDAVLLVIGVFVIAKLLAWRAATKAPMPTKNTGTAAAATDATKKKGQGKRKAAK